MSPDDRQALVGQDTRPKDDPAWVLERYEEAKEILDDLHTFGHAYRLPDDLRETILDWHNATFLDGCTTCAPDCACNSPAAALGQTSPHELYEKAGGDPAEYRRLMVEHGHLVPKLSREECVEQGGHVWPRCDPGYGSVPCTRCGYDPGWVPGTDNEMAFGEEDE